LHIVREIIDKKLYDGIMTTFKVEKVVMLGMLGGDGDFLDFFFSS
jgi:hypothetical protein